MRYYVNAKEDTTIVTNGCATKLSYDGESKLRLKFNNNFSNVETVIYVPKNTLITVFRREYHAPKVSIMHHPKSLSDTIMWLFDITASHRFHDLETFSEFAQASNIDLTRFHSYSIDDAKLLLGNSDGYTKSYMVVPMILTNDEAVRIFTYFYNNANTCKIPYEYIKKVFKEFYIDLV